MSWKQLHAEELYRPFIRMALRHPLVVIGTAVLGVVLSLVLSSTRLAFHTSHLDLVSSGNRYKQLDQAFSREFDEIPERVIVVIHGQEKTQAKAFATALAQRLEGEPSIDKVLYRIRLDALQDKALLFLSYEELTELRQQLEQYRELFLEFAAYPTLQRLFDLLNRGVTKALVSHVFTDFLEDEKQEKKPLDPAFLITLLRQLNQHLEPQQPYHSLWQELFTSTSQGMPHDGFLWSDDQQLLFVFANPKVEAGDVNRFRTAVQQIRQDIRALQQAYPDLEVGITGKAVLETDEMTSAQGDMTIATAISLVGVAILFGAFFRGMVRPGLTVLTLMLGVGWTLGFTTLTIGHLNIFTIVFAPMLIGLGIDSTIHFLTYYEAQRATGQNVRQALEHTCLGTGGGIVIATLTTATAFYALLLSDFLGLRELGFITGSGLVLILLATFTCLPALLVLEERWRGTRAAVYATPLADEPGGYVERSYRNPWATLAASAFLVVLSLLAIGNIGTDFNLLRLQSASNESVVWAERIFASSRRSVLMGEITADSIEDAERKVTALSRLPSVEKVDSILAILPSEQERKLAVIQGLRPVLGETTLQRLNTDTVDLSALQATLGRLNAKLTVNDDAPLVSVKDEVPQDFRVVQGLIARFLQRTQTMPPADVQLALSVFQQELRRDLADQLRLLQKNLEAQPVTIADLPPELRARYVGKTGKFRLFVVPSENVWEPLPLARFVRDLQAVDRDAIGAPVTNFEYMETIKAGYSMASVYAMGGIVFLTFLMFRGALSTILALVPLLVGSVWTLGMMVLFGVQFNMANLLFLPLIIGIGVDNGVHIVHSYRATGKYEGESVPLARSTAKAIILASLTTIVGFGSLMISSHRGIYSLGLVVTLGVGSVLIASLTTLPSLLAILGSAAGGQKATSRSFRETTMSLMSDRVHT